MTLGLSVGLDRTQYLFYLEPLVELEIKPLAPSTACSSPFMLPAIALKLTSPLSIHWFRFAAVVKCILGLAFPPSL